MSVIKPALFSIGMYDTEASRPQKWNCYAIVAWPRHLGFVVINAIKGLWLKTYGPNHIVKSFNSLTFETVRHLSRKQCSQLHVVIGDGRSSFVRDRFLTLVHSCLEEQVVDSELQGKVARQGDQEHLDKLLSSLTPKQVSVLSDEYGYPGLKLHAVPFHQHLMGRLRRNEGNSAQLSQACNSWRLDCKEAIEIAGSPELLERFTAGLDPYRLTILLEYKLFKFSHEGNKKALSPLTDRVIKLIVEKVIIPNPKHAVQGVVDNIKSSYQRYHGFTVEQLRMLIPYLSLNQLLELRLAFAQKNASELIVEIYSHIEASSKKYLEEMEKNWSNLSFKQLDELYKDHSSVMAQGEQARSVEAGVKLIRDFVLARARKYMEQGNKELDTFSPRTEFLKAIVDGWTQQELLTYGSKFPVGLLCDLEPSQVKQIMASKKEEELMVYASIISKKGGFSNAQVLIAVPAMEVILERTKVGKFDDESLKTLKQWCDKSTGAFDYFNKLRLLFNNGDASQRLAGLIWTVQELPVPTPTK